MKKAALKYFNVTFINVIPLLQLLVTLKLFLIQEVNVYTEYNTIVSVFSGYVFALVNPSLKYFEKSTGFLLFKQYLKITSLIYVFLLFIILLFFLLFDFKVSFLFFLIVIFNYVIGLNRFLLYFFQKEDATLNLALYSFFFFFFFILSYWIGVKSILLFFSALIFFNVVILAAFLFSIYRLNEGVAEYNSTRFSTIIIYFIKKQLIPSAILILTLQVDRLFYIFKYGNFKLANISFYITMSSIVSLLGNIFGSILYSDSLKNGIRSVETKFKIITLLAPIIFITLVTFVSEFDRYFIISTEAENYFFIRYTLSNSILFISMLLSYLYYVETSKLKLFLYLSIIPTFFKVIVLWIFTTKNIYQVLFIGNLVYSSSMLAVTFFLLQATKIKYLFRQLVPSISFAILLILCTFFVIQSEEFVWNVLMIIGNIVLVTTLIFYVTKMKFSLFLSQFISQHK